jgi:predicted GIY-YIG superfamily endonuclease
MKGIIYILYFGNLHAYVGQTTRTLEMRLAEHLDGLSKNHYEHYNSYTQRVYNKHGFLNGVVVEECDVDILNEREQHWIDIMRFESKYNICNLQNAKGFSGQYHVLPESMKEHRQKCSIAAKEKFKNPIMLERHRTMQRSASYHEKLSKSSKIAQNNPEVKKRVSNTNKVTWSNPELRKRVSIKQTENWKDDDVRNRRIRRMLESNATEEAKENRTAGQIERFKDTENTKRISLGNAWRFKYNQIPGIFKYLEPFTIDDFTFEDWHHFIIQKNGNVIVFLWDTREVVFLFTIY